VTAYLLKKNCQNPAALLIENGYDESMMADMWMRSFIALGKGKREMSTKMAKKEFPKEMILEKLEALNTEIYDWESHRSSIIHQIQTLKWRGKSSRIISMQVVWKYPYFRDQVNELLLEQDDTENLQKEVQKYKNRYNTRDPKEKQKFYAALLRKGFSYGDIKNALLEEE
jgi:SOS response regulatory protein OraA/RecX